MKVGTRSLLFGAHQFALHPAFVALAWRKLYGHWPDSLPLWTAIVVHDWGYWGKGDMDGNEGLWHPFDGAMIVSRLFDRADDSAFWYEFTAGHSRSFAEQYAMPTSTLMRADKLATVLYPFWLYVALVWLSGEWREYLARWQAAGTYPGEANLLSWARCLQANWARFRSPQAVAGHACGGE